MKMPRKTQGNRIGIYKNYKDLGIIKSTWS